MPIYEKITERMPGGFIVYEATPEAKILFANTATIKMFGCETIDEFMDYVHGSFNGMVYHDDVDSVNDSIDQQIADNKNKNDHVIYRIKRKDGSIRWIDDFGHFVTTENAGDLYYVFIYDITDKKLAEDEAKRAEEALTCEKRLNEAKNTFIFNLSHDFRTPINAILGYLQLAKKHINEPDIANDHLDKVATAGKLLLALIDDLLDLSALDANGIRLRSEPKDLSQVVADTLDMFKPQFTTKNFQVELDLAAGQVEVVVDAPRFQRALSNIVSNACKFTPPEGKIKFSIKRTRESESGFARFEIAVTDSGIGMSEDFLSRIFVAFERERSSTKSGHLGTGIGLTVAKRIMDIMGGTIRVESTQGVGSTFTLSLPLKIYKAQAAEVKPEKIERQPLRGKGRILLVEDIEINRLMAETILTEFGFEVESVPDGCDAVDKVASTPEYYYTAILMDIQMPVMNGYEATRAIRALGRPDIPDLPIIALSANARPEDKEKSFESGMNAHVAKPFDVEGLIATINKYSKYDVRQVEAHS